MSKSFAILVLSSDNYSELWKPFFKCFRENFPVELFPIYLGSNTVVCDEPGVTTILSGRDIDWSTSYKNILKQIPQKKLFVILEDLFLASKVEEELLKDIVTFLFEKDANHIRYWASPLPDKPTCNSLIGECERGAPYRSTVCGFWDVSYLQGLLIKGESPWDFEVFGSYRTSYSDGFYSTYVSICKYKNMVEKGRWIYPSVAWANQRDLVLPIDSMPIPKRVETLISTLRMIVFDCIYKINWRYRVWLLNKLRRLFISY